MTGELVPAFRPPPGAPAIVVKRCNPYGHETGGPRHLLGGMYSAAYEGGMKWTCPNPATVRARMACKFGHRGQVMDLCLPHAREIQRRQSGLCPPCAWPEIAKRKNEQINYLGGMLRALWDAGLWESPKRPEIQKRIEELGQEMTDLLMLGVIKVTPLILTEIS